MHGGEQTHVQIESQSLERLMNLTGELVLSRNQLVQLAGESKHGTLLMLSQRMHAVISELQEIVMKTRMYSMGKVFEEFPDLVRDLSKTYGKQVKVQMEGQNTELDRTLIEAIQEPLGHLARNAIEHGIETPDVRKQQGKSPAGAVAVRAYQEGGQVHITVSDDGVGLDLEQIKATAVQHGLLTPQEAKKASERSLLNLMFHPDFSTTPDGSSDRGMGLETLKHNIAKVGGSVEMHTALHEGTTVKLRIPVTLTIIPALIVSSAGQRFAIPQGNLEELVILNPENGHPIETIYGSEVYRLREELLPLLRLQDVLQLPAQAASESESINIVVLSAGEHRFGLVVDDVSDTEEVVVKPVSSHIKDVACYDGATILSDGNVALILNIDGLFTAAHPDVDAIQNIEHAAAKQEQDTLVSSSAGQHQTIVLFRAGKDEYYGAPLSFVNRLEEFPASRIEHSGGREVLQYRQEILPLIRLESHLNIQPVPDPEILSLIVFGIGKQIGLLANEVINTIEISTDIDTESFQQKGILGSTIVDEHSVLILDIHGLIEMADPIWYKSLFTGRQVTNVTNVERSAKNV